MPISFLSFILIGNKSRISRPANFSLPPETFLIKNEQIQSVFSDEKRIGITKAAKICSPEVIEQLAKSLVGFHKPIKFNFIDKFGIREFLEKNNEFEHNIGSINNIKNNNKNNENKNIEIKSNQAIEKTIEIKNENKNNKIVKNKKNKVCETCGVDLDSGVVFWCNKNKNKFNNKMLCREHQPK
jgi:aminoglycoside phosphotransferase family enzyme